MFVELPMLLFLLMGSHCGLLCVVSAFWHCHINFLLSHFHFMLQVLSGIALWSFKVAKAPKDKEHPYGHS